MRRHASLIACLFACAPFAPCGAQSPDVNGSSLPLSAQRELANRLFAEIRAACPAGTFVPGDLSVLPTDASPESIAQARGETLERFNVARNSLGEAKVDDAYRILCEAVMTRARVIGGLHPLTVAGYNNMAVILRTTGRSAHARRISEELLPLVRGYPREGVVATRGVLHNLATALFMQGHFDSAEVLFKDALALAEQSGEAPGSTLTNLAMLYDAQGRMADAEDAHRQAYELRKSTSDAQGLAASANNLGANLTRQGRLQEGEQLLRESMEGRQGLFGERHLNTAFTALNLSQNLAVQGKLTEARQLAETVLDLRRSTLGNEHPETAAAFLHLSKIQLEQRDYAGALENARAALAARIPATHREEANLGADARANVRKGLSAAAYHLVQAAWSIRQQRGLATERDALTAEAFAAAQRIPVSDTADAFAQALARQEHAGADQAMIQLEHRREQLLEIDGLIASAIVAGRSSSASAYATLKGEQRRVADEIVNLERALQKTNPAYLAFVRPAPVELGALRSSLREGEALVVFAMSEEGAAGYVWAVSRKDTAWAQLPIPAASLRVEIEALRAQLNQVSSAARRPDSGTPAQLGRGGYGFDVGRAQRLYWSLLGDGGIQRVLRSSERWIVVPQGRLISLPFAALVASEDPPAATDSSDPAVLRSTPFLGLHKALSFLPAVANLRQLRTSTASASTRRPTRAFFGLGDPQFVFEPNPELPASGDPRRSLERLPATREEIEALARNFGASQDDYLLGPDASETQLNRAVASGRVGASRVIAIATHGLLPGALDGSVREPALALSAPAVATTSDDGLLLASEAARLRLSADWVILSACDTAAGVRPESEGLTGLARAFLYAGGRALLVSQWQVNDEAAAYLTTETFRRGAVGSPSRSQALQRAMQALANETSQDQRIPNAHPAVWAPFVMIGVD